MKITKEVKTALLAIVAVILLIFGYSFLKGKNILENSKIIYAKYENVGGLIKSSGVFINGLQVGSVTDIKFISGSGELLIKMNIDTDLGFSNKSIAEIGGDLIGAKYVTIYPEFEGKVIETGDTISSQIEQGLIDQFTPTQRKLDRVLVDADTLVKSVNNILDEDTQANLRETIASTNQIMKDFTLTMRKINRIMDDNSGKLKTTVANFEQSSEDLTAITANLKEVDIKALISNIEGTLADFKEISGKLNSEKGTMGKLMNDPELYNNLDIATKQMAALLQDLKLNPTRYINVSVFGKKNKPYIQPNDSLK
ncbi:MlaD family protein [Gangjinia marincola]|uniref:MlaD family protein n=1 Tax=Gangjinia marincola TaxID=578463 RepID=A0ABP3XTS4_9FLAO